MASDRTPHSFPTFENVEDERRHRKQRLAAAFRLFGQFGFDEGVAGHITARDPERLDHFWVNPFGMNFKQIRVQDLHPGEPRGRGRRGQLAGQPGRLRHPLPGPRRPPRRDRRRPRPLGATARPGRRCAGRSTRSPRTPAPSTTTTPSSTTSPASCSTSRRASASPTPSATTRPPSSPTTACSPSASTVDEAAWWFITMERTCQAQLLAEAAGTPVLIDPEQAELTAAQVGAPAVGLVLRSSPSTTGSPNSNRTCSRTDRRWRRARTGPAWPAA